MLHQDLGAPKIRALHKDLPVRQDKEESTQSFPRDIFRQRLIQRLRDLSQVLPKILCDVLPSSAEAKALERSRALPNQRLLQRFSIPQVNQEQELQYP
jgi:hypothetical protein